MLADNVFGRSIKPAIENFERQERGARIVLSKVEEPEHLRHLGVAELDGDKVVRIVEKPEQPPSEYAVTGLYFYDSTVFDVPAVALAVCRGELEITDVNNWFVEQGDDGVRRGRGLLGRRGRVDRRLLRGQRLRAPERRQPVIEGLRRIPLRRFEDERGWFVEVNRAGWHDEADAPDERLFSRAGVIRGLHYHERGQDDLFVCLQGTARVVVLDLSSGEAFTEDIGDENPVGIYVPGRCAHGFEALTDLLFCYHVTEEYDPGDPDEHEVPWNDPRVVDLWSTRSPILSERDQAAS